MSEWATADICPHGISSSICEWCGYKSTSEIRLQIIDKLEYRIEKLREALEFYAKLTDHPADLELTSTLVSFGSTARQALEADGECE